jgi:hypothetical protein
MFGTHTQRQAEGAPGSPWVLPTNTAAREGVKRRHSRGGFLVGVLSSAALVAAFVGISSSASAANSAWTQYYYNSSGHALKATAATSTAADSASFNFAPGVYTALLTTNAKAFTGDLTGTTMSATVSVTGMTSGATFVDQNGGGCTPDNQYVRLYFESSSGKATGVWWATWGSPGFVNLSNNLAPTTISQALSNPAQWSDLNGQLGSAVPGAFATAVSKVTSVGVSFGGGCFFENGVTTSDGSGTFTLTGFLS